MGLDWSSEIELDCHVADHRPGSVQLYEVQTLLALVLIFLQRKLELVKERSNFSHILHLQTFRLKT